MKKKKAGLAHKGSVVQRGSPKPPVTTKRPQKMGRPANRPHGVEFRSAQVDGEGLFESGSVREIPVETFVSEFPVDIRSVEGDA